jgi:pilus assembly protein Flp/PilA
MSVFQFYNREEVMGMLFVPKERGQGLVEYALILVLIAIVVIAVIGVLGSEISNVFQNIANTL